MSRAKYTITFVTGNKGKLKEVREMFAESEFDLVSKDIDLPELQGEPEEISRDKCALAAKEIGGPVIVEDTSLCYNALHGLPGPYIKWFLKKTGHEGLNNLLAAYEDKSAYALCMFSFSPGPESEDNIVSFEGRTDGTIVEARGPKDFGWDPVFQPDGFDQTFAEMDSETKNSISHRGRAVAKLRDYLLSNSDALTGAKE